MGRFLFPDEGTKVIRFGRDFTNIANVVSYLVVLLVVFVFVVTILVLDKFLRDYYLLINLVVGGLSLSFIIGVLLSLFVKWIWPKKVA